MEPPNPRIVAPWSDLPPELLGKIAKRLPSEIDIRRFRAVCRSWRSSTPPYKFPTINLPFPFDAAQNPDPKHTGAYFTLTQRIVYRIQSPDPKYPDFWLVKVELADNGRVRIINPVTHRRIKIPPAVRMPKVLNLLDFDVAEVCKAYALRYVNPSNPDERDDYYDYRHAKKVAFSANFENDEYIVMAIDLQSRLWHIKSGSKIWTLFHGYTVMKDNFAAARFYDVASIKGRLCATDGSGDIWEFDSKFGWRTGGSYNGDRALKRRLVDLCNGEMVLVEEMGKVDGPCLHNFRVNQHFVDVGVYALSKLLNKWLDVKAMHGCIIVVGDDCSFSVPTTEEFRAARVFYADRYVFLQDEIFEVYGDYTCIECDCGGNICYCLDEVEPIVADDVVANDDVKRLYEGCYGQNIGVCDCETGKTGTALMFPEYASIFWPPPPWLRREVVNKVIRAKQKAAAMERAIERLDSVEQRIQEIGDKLDVQTYYDICTQDTSGMNEEQLEWHRKFVALAVKKLGL